VVLKYQNITLFLIYILSWFLKMKNRPKGSSQNCRFFAEEALWFFEVSEITKTDGAKIIF